MIIEKELSNGLAIYAIMINIFTVWSRLKNKKEKKRKENIILIFPNCIPFLNIDHIWYALIIRNDNGILSFYFIIFT